MRLNRSENTKRNIIVGEIDKISGILLPFFVRTMILHVIGAEYLGLTGLFYSILQMLNLTEMGFGTAIVYSMYQPIAQNDTKMINALLTFYKKVYQRVGIAVMGVGMALMPFLPRLIHGAVPADINLYLLYLVYLSNSCIGFFVFPERKALLIAHQRDDLGARIHIFTQLGMYLAQAACILLSKNYYLYALMMPLSSLWYSLLCAKQVRKQYPIYLGGGRIDPGICQEIKKQVIGLTIRKAAVMSRDAFDSIFVSAFLGLSMTAIYANYYYIMDSVVMILAVVKTSMAGGVGNSIALDSPERNLQKMHQIDFLFLWISGWCAVCLLCLYQPFMILWLGKNMTLPFEMVVLFSVYFYVLKMGDIRTLYGESAGIWWQARYLSIAEAAANLCLNWMMVQWMGLKGIILATLISYFIFNFIGGAALLYKYYFTQGGLAGYMLSHMKYAAVTGVAGVITYAAAWQIQIGGLAGFALKAAVCAVVPNFVFYLAYCKTKDFKDSMTLLAAVRKIRW